MKRSLLLLASLLLLGLAGCSSKSEFYRLHPTIAQSSGERTIHTRRILGIGEVQVADYLEKPEIVTRLASVQFKVHDTDRWAGSLAGSVQEVLQQDLSALLPRHTVLSYPWDEPVSDNYRLYVTVDRFDGDANGTVTFSGHWSLANQSDGRVVTGEKYRYIERGEPTTAGIVATQSALLERLSRRIASKVKRYF